MRKPITTTSLLIVGLALFVSACSSHDKPSKPAAPPHAMQGQQLRDTMHQLAEQNAYLPAGKLPPDPESNRKFDPKVFDEAEKLASSLAQTAAKIPTSKGDNSLRGRACRVRG